MSLQLNNKQRQRSRKSRKTTLLHQGNNNNLWNFFFFFFFNNNSSGSQYYLMVIILIIIIIVTLHETHVQQQQTVKWNLWNPIVIDNKLFFCNHFVHSFSIQSIITRHHHHHYHRIEYKNKFKYPSPFIIPSKETLKLFESLGSNSDAAEQQNLNDTNNNNNNNQRQKQQHHHNNNNNNVNKYNNKSSSPKKEKKKKKLDHYELKTKVLRQFRDISEYYMQAFFHSVSENRNSSLSLNNNDNNSNNSNLFKTIETDILNTIWTCQSIPEIYDLLWHIVHFAKKISTVHHNTRTINNNNNSNNNSNTNNSNTNNSNTNNNKKNVPIILEKDMNEKGYGILTRDDFALLGPNIASAILRRIVDLQQQRQNQQWRKRQKYSSGKMSSNSNNDNDNNNNNDDELIEKIVLQRYIPTLLHSMTEEVTLLNVQQKEVNSSFLSQPSEKSLPTTLFQPFHQWTSQLDAVFHHLDQTESFDQSTTTTTKQNSKETVFDQQITHYSCANYLHSIGILLRSSKEHDNGVDISFMNEHLHEIVNKMSLLLLEPIATTSTSDKSFGENVDNPNINATFPVTPSSPVIQSKLLGLTPKRLLEIMISLATLVQYQNNNDKQRDYNDLSTDFMIPIRSTLPTIMKSDTLPLKSSPSVTILIHTIGNRLYQGDAIGKFNGNDLSLGLWSLFILRSFHYDMIKSFMKRLRKKTLRETLNGNEICKSLWSIGQLMEMLNELEGKQLQMKRRQEQIALENRNNDSGSFDPNSQIEENESYDSWYEGTSIEAQNQVSFEMDDETHRMNLSHEETAIIFDQSITCCYTLLKELNREYVRNHVSRNQETFKTKKLHGLKERQIADILYTCVLLDLEEDDDVVRDLVYHLGQTSDFHSRYRVADITRILWSMQRLNIKNQRETISTLIDHFLHLMSERKEDATVPKTLITIMRSIVLILPDNGRNETGILQALLPLLKNEAYLKRCNEFETSNFMFILAMADLYDKEALISLAGRMMEYEILESSTPSSASRFLWSFSKLVNKEEDYEMDELLFESFQALGGVLLSSQLTPVDASNAMWAIAKSSYSLDLGVFDHLAEMLAKDEMLERATIQQVCFGLWSCGKMINFEDPLREKMEHGEVTPPPYLSYATKYATFLVSVVEQMTAKDIAQVSVCDCDAFVDQSMPVFHFLTTKHNLLYKRQYGPSAN